MSQANSWNFDVGRLIVLCLLLLLSSVGFTKEGWIVLLTKLKQSVELMNNNQAINVYDDNNCGYDSITQVVLFPDAKSDVKENVNGRQDQVWKQVVFLLLQGSDNERNACEQVEKVDRQKTRQEDM